MERRIVVILSAIVFASVVLGTSALKAASVKQNFSSENFSVDARRGKEISVDYELPYPGRILPDNPLWFFKALRDKALLLLAQDPVKRAELKLLFADKRLGASKILFEEKKVDAGLSTLTKGEKYLEEARREGSTPAFLEKLAKSSLKHREIAQKILDMSPEEVKPKIVQVQDYSKNVYKEARDALSSQGIDAPKSPFDRN